MRLGDAALHILGLHNPDSSKEREVSFVVHSVSCVNQHVTLTEQSHLASSVSVRNCSPAGHAMLTTDSQTPNNCINPP